MKRGLLQATSRRTVCSWACGAYRACKPPTDTLLLALRTCVQAPGRKSNFAEIRKQNKNFSLTRRNALAVMALATFGQPRRLSFSRTTSRMALTAAPLLLAQDERDDRFIGTSLSLVANPYIATTWYNISKLIRDTAFQATTPLQGSVGQDTSRPCRIPTSTLSAPTADGRSSKTLVMLGRTSTCVISLHDLIPCLRNHSRYRKCKRMRSQRVVILRVMCKLRRARITNSDVSQAFPVAFMFIPRPEQPVFHETHCWTQHQIRGGQ